MSYIYIYTALTWLHFSLFFQTINLCKCLVKKNFCMNVHFVCNYFILLLFKKKLTKLENQICVVWGFPQSWLKSHVFIVYIFSFGAKRIALLEHFWSMVCGIVQASGLKMILRILINWNNLVVCILELKSVLWLVQYFPSNIVTYGLWALLIPVQLHNLSLMLYFFSWL